MVEALRQWQLEASGPRAYEAYLVPRIFAPWAERLVALAGVREGDRVLDVGCGTGIVARTAAAAAGASGAVTGVDLNPAMLETARAVAAEVRPAINWREGDAASLPFEDSTFDTVLSQQAIQFFPDRSRALAEMHRVLAGGGRLGLGVLRGIDENPVYGTLAGLLARYVGPQAGEMMRSPFAGWMREEARALVMDAGFLDVRVISDVGPVRYPSAAEFVRQEIASSPLAGEVLPSNGGGGADPDAIDALVRDFEAALAPRTDDEGVVFPIETWMITARR